MRARAGSPARRSASRGAPSDTAVLDSILLGSGARPAAVKRITIGFNAVGDLLAGRVAAATAFWNDEGVTLARRRPGFHVFRVEAYGAPAYPELVLCASAHALTSDPSLARDTVTRPRARLRRDARRPGGRRPRARVPRSRPRRLAGQRRAARAAARLPRSRWALRGARPGAACNAWAQWEARFGIVKHPPDVATTFDRAFAPAG